MFRKRKNATSAFRMTSPHQPITGEQAKLRIDGFYPYSAILQVAKEDVHLDYVICRGFDVRYHRFIDYEAGNSDKPGLPVAKPYGKRQTGNYEIAQVFLAVLPLQTTNPSPSEIDWRVRQNPGVAAVTQGHPANLNEKIDELWTDDGTELISWMLIDEGGSGGGGSDIEFTIVSANTGANPKTALVDIESRPCGQTMVTDEVAGQVTVVDPSGCFLDELAADLVGRWGGATYLLPDGAEDCQWRFTWLCCKPCP